MLVRRSIATSVLAVAALLAAPARAEDPEIARARALFDEAGELERQGRWTAAQERIRAAMKVRETPHLRYALGWALENDDKLLEAKAEYETAARLAQQRADADDVARLAAARLAEVERKTPLVQVRVAGGAAAGARVVVDGHATSMQGDVVTVPVNPGSRVVRVERGGRTANEQLVYVPRGMMRVVEVRIDETVASRTAAQDRHGAAEEALLIPRDAMAKGHAPVLPIVLAAGGAALAVGGGLLFISSASDASARDESMRRWCDATACVDGTTATLPESPEAAALRRDANAASERGNTKQIIGATMAGVGLVGAAVGTYLLVRGHDERSTRAAAVPIAAPIAGGAIAGTVVRF